LSITRIAVIGGSGFESGFGGTSEQHTAPGGTTRTVVRKTIGPSAEIVFIARHGAGHETPPHLVDHKATIRILAGLDIDGIVATAAVGSLRIDFKPGDFVVLDDFIDLTRGPVVTLFDELGAVRHTDFATPFDPEFRRRLIDKRPENDTVHEKGTYLCLSGPRYETPAEVRLFASWGADVVGMTVAPEAILAREAGLPYAAVAVVTNYGCGLITPATISHSEVEAGMAAARSELTNWIGRVVTQAS
jgi:5'-methylthioadenosine phosphorylase